SAAELSKQDHAEGLCKLGAGTRALFPAAMGPAIRDCAIDERYGRAAVKRRITGRALRQRQLHLHELRLVSTTAGGTAGRLPVLRKPDQLREKERRLAADDLHLHTVIPLQSHAGSLNRQWRTPARNKVIRSALNERQRCVAHVDPRVARNFLLNVFLPTEVYETEKANNLESRT